jgi:hypothetical protein
LSASSTGKDGPNSGTIWGRSGRVDDYVLLGMADCGTGAEACDSLSTWLLALMVPAALLLLAAASYLFAVLITVIATRRSAPLPDPALPTADAVSVVD